MKKIIIIILGVTLFLGVGYILYDEILIEKHYILDR